MDGLILMGGVNGHAGARDKLYAREAQQQVQA
jgi:hypothetical protein